MTNQTTVKFLAISGSLRQASSNLALLKAAQTLAPANIQITLYNHLGDLPHFNPDNEFEPNETVAHLKEQVDAADGLIVSSPEYAHGVPGSLKNGLDWLVGGPEFYEKPVAFFNASGRGIHAQASLREIVKTMSGHIVEEACMTLPFISKKINQTVLETDPELVTLIRQALQNYVSFLKENNP